MKLETLLSIQAEILIQIHKSSIFPWFLPEDNELDNIEETEIFAEFRVRKRDIERLADALGLPESFICYQRTRADKLEGLCMVLKRLAYPCRYSDEIHRFGRAVPELSMITNAVEEFIYQNHHHRLTRWNANLLSPVKLEEYAEAVAAKGSPLRNCFGFIDGTVRPISRPGEAQKAVYNGHKRIHALKFQSVTLPNGLIAHLFGPVGISRFRVWSLFIFTFKHKQLFWILNLHYFPTKKEEKRWGFW